MLLTHIKLTFNQHFGINLFHDLLLVGFRNLHIFKHLLDKASEIAQFSFEHFLITVVIKPTFKELFSSLRKLTIVCPARIHLHLSLISNAHARVNLANVTTDLLSIFKHFVTKFASDTFLACRLSLQVKFFI